MASPGGPGPPVSDILTSPPTTCWRGHCPEGGGEKLRGSLSGEGIHGTVESESIYALSRKDGIFGGADADEIYSGSGRDMMSGCPGDDFIEVKDGVRDSVVCGAGRDIVSADEKDLVSSDCEIIYRA